MSVQSARLESYDAARKVRVQAHALVLRAVVAFSAFVIAVLLPLRASAMIIPTCEADAVTQMTPTLNMSCDEAAEAAFADGTAAPICDPLGASAVAPPRLLPVADARIEAAPPCGETASVLGAAVGPHSGDHPALTNAAILDYTMLTASLFIPPAPFVESADLPASVGGPLAGTRQDVYHPPR